MKRNSRLSLFLVYLLAFTMVFQGPCLAQLLASLPIIIVVKVTTHPDYYNSHQSQEMVGLVVGDLDCDWVLEIVGAGYNPDTQKSNIYIWHRDGVLQSEWEIDGKISHPPAIGDLDNDGDLEIVASISKLPPEVGGYIYVWHHDGTLYEGYPEELDYIPGAPHIGDISGGFEDEIIVLDETIGVGLADMDNDGKKELILAGPGGIGVYGGEGEGLDSWQIDLINVGDPVVGDVDGDNNHEVFLAVRIPDVEINYIYGWDNNGELIGGDPINIAGVVNAPGNFLTIADIDGDGIAEIISGSHNGWIAGWRLDGSVLFSHKPPVEGEDADTNVIYQPLVGDIDNDGDMEILAKSKYGDIYCYDHNGNPVEGWPYHVNCELSYGAVLVDIDQDSVGDSVNPAGDLELLFSANDGRIYSIDLAGDFNPNTIQWGMYGFNSRNNNNYLRDWDTEGWSIFDNEPLGAVIESVYDWNRGSRVIELKGAGLNNCYVFKKADGRPFNSKDTTIQWSMRYGLPFNIYISVDTIKGLRFLHYSPVDGNQLLDETGRYIHHGLGEDAKNGRWHTFSRSLVTDLKEGEPDNEIIDINSFYIQGSGRVDDISLFPGLPVVDIVNIARDASIEVSSGEDTSMFINDGNPDTKWVSDDEDISWVKLTWDGPQKMNKIVIQGAEGARSGVLFLVDSEGNVYEIEFELPEDGSPLEIIFDTLNDIKSVIVVFDNDGGSISIGEIEVYYDPSLDEGAPPEEEGPPQEEYTSDTYIQIRDDYFFDPTLGENGSYWIPHGIAYQTWNRALGQWQSPAEIRRDLDRMIEIGANALRVDFVWKHIEIEDGMYDWANFDMLLEETQVRGLKIFPIIGYQWPPDWFPEEWYTMHPPCEAYPEGPWLSDILSYEDPDVLEQFRDFLQAVVRRYSIGGIREDLADTVAGWILGNEYGYMGLWSIEYDGYDPDCQAAFREWLSERYYGDITALNEKWAQDNIRAPGYLPNYPYENFDEVDMPISFGYEGETRGKYLARDKASWYDLTQWREESIAKFIALAAQAVKEADPYHLITYTAVGMQWGEEDWRYHTEDARKITKACEDIGSPFDFWSINNYPWGMENNELMTGQWGIACAMHDTGLPVMITETGFTSTENMYSGVDQERQAKLTRNAIWETLESGAIGVCVFHWNDREQPGLTAREKGFGIVDINGDPKPAYFTVQEAFSKMDKIDIAQYIVGSSCPVPDVAFLWDDAVDTIINRYKAEMNALFGTLERLGYEPYFINDEELLDRKYSDYSAIILPRNQKMFDSTFDLLLSINSAGVKIHADSDLPGIMNEYGQLRDRDNWLKTMEELFGIDAANSTVDPDLEDNIYYDGYETSSFGLRYMPKTLYYPDIGFYKTVGMWKYRDRILNNRGIVAATFDNENGNPALVFHFNTAISLFSLGDNKPINNTPYDDWTWLDRYNWMKSIYSEDTGFGIVPRLIVSNPYILVDYRICADGSILLSFKNYRADSIETTTVSTDLITGKVIISLLTDELLDGNCSGTIQRTLEPDGHDLLLAYTDGDDLGQEPPDIEGDPEDSNGGDDDSGEDNNSNGDSSGEEDSGKNSGDINTNIPNNSSNSRSNNNKVDIIQEDSGNINSNSGNSSGSYSVVYLEDNENRRVENNPNESIELPSGNSTGADVIYYKRSYSGTETRSSDEVAVTEEMLEDSGVLVTEDMYDSSRAHRPKLPPLEQFRQAMDDKRYKEMGQIKVKPKPSKKKLEEIIRPSRQIKRKDSIEYKKNIVKIMAGWMDRLKQFLGNMLNTLRFVSRNVPRLRYAQAKDDVISS